MFTAELGRLCHVERDGNVWTEAEKCGGVNGVSEDLVGKGDYASPQV